MISSQRLKNIRRWRFNSRNVVIFDETVIGDSVTVPLVIGERRKSGGDSNNFVHTRQARLGCFIPFWMLDGTTPFRVFIFRHEDVQKDETPFRVLAPKQEKGYRGDPYRLYLANETGCLSKAVFHYIIVMFAKWWRSTQGVVDCFLISDILHIPTNKEVKAFAKSMGIHIKNIMPGTSHWFQVHDQQPFGALKKKMADQKFELWTSIKTTVEDEAS